MNISRTTIVALLAAFVIGCSKHPSTPSSHASVNTKELGVIEFTENAPQHFSLGGGRSCMITVRHALLGGIKVDFEIEATNTDGTVQVLARPSIHTVTDSRCDISVEDVGVALTPKWKSP
jgi:Flp pilus assembly secretin CpaC